MTGQFVPSSRIKWDVLVLPRGDSGEKMKCASRGSGCPLPKKSKHKLGYNVTWKDEFPWHFPVYVEEGNAESGVSGLLCSICQRHGTKQRNSAGTWTESHVPICGRLATAT